MKYKIIYHIMPWEIDYALLAFSQLKKSKFYIPQDVSIEIETVLNLSSYIIDWDQSKLPKEFFIEKYDQISALLIDYKHNKKIYDGDELYGHLNSQRESYQKDIDFYICACPDTYFNERLLYYMIESSKQIKNKYFILTPQICRMWDESWEILTHNKYKIGPHYGWEKTVDIFEVDYFLNNSEEQVKITAIDQLKWAGWFDLYNKEFAEDLTRIPEDWKGYGAWDFYGLSIATYAKRLGLDFQQYRLDGQIVFEYSVGPLRNEKINGFSDYYKKFLVKKDVSEQRESFNENVNKYIIDKIKNLQ